MSIYLFPRQYYLNAYGSVIFKHSPGNDLFLSQIKECDPITITNGEALANGAVLNGTKIPVNTVVSFRCREGFNLSVTSDCKTVLQCFISIQVFPNQSQRKEST